MYCYNNQLTSLPTLPENIENIVSHNNPLNSLPENIDFSTQPDFGKAVKCTIPKTARLPDFLHTINIVFPPIASFCSSTPVLTENLENIKL